MRNSDTANSLSHRAGRGWSRPVIRPGPLETLLGGHTQSLPANLPNRVA